ncbi:MAG: amino acid adenylation domain-containing protein, partial [Candidatus Eremiobacteraeota bacterium]|nr:amino acid adenylation domain-containing protein [Candidatus Eremiobacteraeota bacterium]
VVADAERANDWSVDIVLLHSADDFTSSAARPTRRANDREPAYMIYTSGSTGRPKGALNDHRAICNRLAWMQSRYALTPDDVVLQKTPFSFDVSVWEFFWPLLNGARLVLARPGGHRDSAYLIELIEARRVSVIHFVPSMLRVFLEDPNVERCTTLRHVMCSGEALAPDLVAAWYGRSAAALHNLYGPTEAAIDVTHWTAPRGWSGTTVPIGRPVANTQLYVLDARGAPVPIGIAGELSIGGVQVGMGYHRRPELTAEKFVADPFGSDAGGRLYRTGDLVRYREDGNLEYLGRLDNQIKLRGFRIELGEIESVMLRGDALRDAVVVLREDVPGSVSLVAYYVPAD